MRTGDQGRWRWLAASAAGACVVGLVTTGAGASPPPRAATTTTTTTTTTCGPAVNLSTWSLPRLAAQTVAIPVQAGSVARLSHEVQTGFGGILLFGTSAPRGLGPTLRRLQAQTPQGLGMLVMTDEEGGGVLRLDNLVGQFPWPRTMAQTLSAPAITALARRVGTQLLAAGVTTDLAPVLDVDGRDVDPGAKDPDGFRSFGGSVPVVITDGEAFARGLEAAHVLPVVKHFPGLGGSTGNTDDGPAATLPWPVLKAGALHTFEADIRAGAPAIMVANARVPGLTPLPASISSSVMTGVLRTWLHFKGLILTDSLTAGAISAVPLSVPTAAVDAIAAGADMVLLGEQQTTRADVSLAIQVSGAIASAVSHGALARSTLEAAAAKVLASRGVLACTP